MQKHHNNFDFLRLVAALFVWYDHCYALLLLPDPMSRTIGFESFGSLGVAIFFIISGYFIPASYVAHNNIRDFARNRALRILPALWVVVLVSVFLIGPLMTSYSFGNYMADGRTWRYLNSLLIFPLQYKLPGVFAHNTNDAVNGSLWTLKHEVRLYIAVALLGLLGILRLRVVAGLLLLFCCIRVYCAYHMEHNGGLIIDVSGFHFIKMGPETIQLASLFGCGTILFLLRDYKLLRKEYFFLAVLAIAAGLYWRSPLTNLTFDIPLAYLVIYIGFLKIPYIGNFGRFGDFSYGIYLYAYPMQQLCLDFFHINNAYFMLCSFLLTVSCGALSWYLVEKPALSLKH